MQNVCGEKGADFDLEYPETPTLVRIYALSWRASNEIAGVCRIITVEWARGEDSNSAKTSHVGRTKTPVSNRSECYSTLCN